MVQEILTYIIILSAFVITIYRVMQFFISKKDKNECSGCIGGQCSLKHIH